MFFCTFAGAALSLVVLSTALDLGVSVAGPGLTGSCLGGIGMCLGIRTLVLSLRSLCSLLPSEVELVSSSVASSEASFFLLLSFGILGFSFGGCCLGAGTPALLAVHAPESLFIFVP